MWAGIYDYMDPWQKYWQRQLSVSFGAGFGIGTLFSCTDSFLLYFIELYAQTCWGPLPNACPVRPRWRKRLNITMRSRCKTNSLMCRVALPDDRWYRCHIWLSSRLLLALDQSRLSHRLAMKLWDRTESKNRARYQYTCAWDLVLADELNDSRFHSIVRSMWVTSMLYT